MKPKQEVLIVVRPTPDISIIFLVEPFSSPSTRFRVLQNIPELEALNFNVTVREIPRSIGSRIRLINTLSSYDIVLLQRKLFQWWFLRYIRFKSKILIYDFDDALMFSHHFPISQ